MIILQFLILLVKEQMQKNQILHRDYSKTGVFSHATLVFRTPMYTGMTTGDISTEHQCMVQGKGGGALTAQGWFGDDV